MKGANIISNLDGVLNVAALGPCFIKLSIVDVYHGNREGHQRGSTVVFVFSTSNQRVSGSNLPGLCVHLVIQISQLKFFNAISNLLLCENTL